MEEGNNKQYKKNKSNTRERRMPKSGMAAFVSDIIWLIKIILRGTWKGISFASKSIMKLFKRGKSENTDDKQEKKGMHFGIPKALKRLFKTQRRLLADSRKYGFSYFRALRRMIKKTVSITQYNIRSSFRRISFIRRYSVNQRGLKKQTGTVYILRDKNNGDVKDLYVADINGKRINQSRNINRETIAASYGVNKTIPDYNVYQIPFYGSGKNLRKLNKIGFGRYNTWIVNTLVDKSDVLKPFSLREDVYKLKNIIPNVAGFRMSDTVPASERFNMDIELQKMDRDWDISLVDEMIKKGNLNGMSDILEKFYTGRANIRINDIMDLLVKAGQEDIRKLYEGNGEVIDDIYQLIKESDEFKSFNIPQELSTLLESDKIEFNLASEWMLTMGAAGVVPETPAEDNGIIITNDYPYKAMEKLKTLKDGELWQTKLRNAFTEGNLSKRLEIMNYLQLDKHDNPAIIKDICFIICSEKAFAMSAINDRENEPILSHLQNTATFDKIERLFYRGKALVSPSLIKNHLNPTALMFCASKIKDCMEKIREIKSYGLQTGFYNKESIKELEREIKKISFIASHYVDNAEMQGLDIKRVENLVKMAQDAEPGRLNSIADGIIRIISAYGKKSEMFNTLNGILVQNENLRVCCAEQFDKGTAVIKEREDEKDVDIISDLKQNFETESYKEIYTPSNLFVYTRFLEDKNEKLSNIDTDKIKGIESLINISPLIKSFGNIFEESEFKDAVKYTVALSGEYTKGNITPMQYLDMTGWRYSVMEHLSDVEGREIADGISNFIRNTVAGKEVEFTLPSKMRDYIAITNDIRDMDMPAPDNIYGIKSEITPPTVKDDTPKITINDVPVEYLEDNTEQSASLENSNMESRVWDMDYYDKEDYIEDGIEAENIITEKTNETLPQKVKDETSVNSCLDGSESKDEVIEKVSEFARKNNTEIPQSIHEWIENLNKVEGKQHIDVPPEMFNITDYFHTRGKGTGDITDIADNPELKLELMKQVITDAQMTYDYMRGKTSMNEILRAGGNEPSAMDVEERSAVALDLLNQYYPRLKTLGVDLNEEANPELVRSIVSSGGRINYLDKDGTVKRGEIEGLFVVLGDHPMSGLSFSDSGEMMYNANDNCIAMLNPVFADARARKLGIENDKLPYSLQLHRQSSSMGGENSYSLGETQQNLNRQGSGMKM